MERANLFGRLGMILCWYWDGSDDEGEGLNAIRGVQLLPKLLAGRTQSFKPSDWWLFVDAVGSYPHRDETLDAVYELARAGYEGELPPGRTRAFGEEE